MNECGAESVRESERERRESMRGWFSRSVIWGRWTQCFNASVFNFGGEPSSRFSRLDIAASPFSCLHYFSLPPSFLYSLLFHKRQFFSPVLPFLSPPYLWLTPVLHCFLHSSSRVSSVSFCLLSILQITQAVIKLKRPLPLSTNTDSIF